MTAGMETGMKNTYQSLFCTTAVVLVLIGCAESNTERADQTPAAALTNANHQPASNTLPNWEPDLKPYGFVSKEGEQQFYIDAKKFHGESIEDAGDYYDILGVGCSWYCGGEAWNVTASSTLAGQGPNTYIANHAHDLGYDTAWVEGVEGPGIGQTLTYTFTNKCPRITHMHIHTGYTKDEITWIKNNRVRTLELSINGESIAKLQLADTRAQQSFNFEAFGLGPLGRRADGKDLTLTFKILDVYPGTTYDDTAITEIYFDGIDVH